MPVPESQGHLEEALMVIHNTLILCGWLKEPTVMLSFHHSFWKKCRDLTAPKKGRQIPHTINDIMRAHKAFQKQWALWSETHKHLDRSIKQSMPKEEDMPEARMALRPMYAFHRDSGERTRTKGKQDKGKGIREQKWWGLGQQSKGQKKGKGKGLTPVEQSLRDRLANQLGVPRHQVLQTRGGPPAGNPGATRTKGARRDKGKSKGKTKDKDRGKQKGAPQVCAQYMAGNCTFGDRCRYLHKVDQANRDPRRRY